MTPFFVIFGTIAFLLILTFDFANKQIKYSDDKKKLFKDPSDAFTYWIPFGRLILTIKTDARELNDKLDKDKLA